MAKVRDVTDPCEFTQAVLDEVRRGNTQTREKIRRLRGLLNGGLAEEERLKVELEGLKAEVKANG